MRMTDLKPGWAVVANDGRRLGTIREVGQNYVLASRGGLSGELYVPASAIANVDSEAVYLNLAKDQAEAMGWEQPPRNEDELETAPESDLHRHV
jgi:hypothetical protein